MKLPLNKLAQHLQSNLAPVYIISGDEPLLVQEAHDNIHFAAKKKGFDDRQRFDVSANHSWDEFRNALQHRSLFSDKTLFDVFLPTGKPGKTGAQVFTKFAAHPPSDKCLVLITGKLDQGTQNTSWYKKLSAAGIALQIWPIDRQHFPGWLQQRLRHVRLDADRTGIDLLSRYTEGNLLAASQEIQKLKLLYDEGMLSLDQINASISDNARFNSFQLIDTALTGDAPMTLRILKRLHEESFEPLLLLGALSKELNALLKMASDMKDGQSTQQVMEKNRVWQKRKPMVNIALQRCTVSTLFNMQHHAANIDAIVKGIMPGNVWEQLQDLFLKLAGNPVRGTSL